MKRSVGLRAEPPEAGLCASGRSLRLCVNRLRDLELVGVSLLQEGSEAVAFFKESDPNSQFKG